MKHMTLNQKLLAALNKHSYTSYMDIIAKASRHGYVRNPLTWTVAKMRHLISKGLVEGDYFIGYKLK